MPHLFIGKVRKLRDHSLAKEWDSWGRSIAIGWKNRWRSLKKIRQVKVDQLYWLVSEKLSSTEMITFYPKRQKKMESIEFCILMAFHIFPLSDFTESKQSSVSGLSRWDPVNIQLLSTRVGWSVRPVKPLQGVPVSLWGVLKQQESSNSAARALQRILVRTWKHNPILHLPKWKW